MDFLEYKTLVSELTVGKRLPDSVYVHESALDTLPEALTTFIARVIAALNLDDTPWNIAKFFRRDFKVALLHYPTFFDEAYPSLHQSHSIDLVTGTVRSTDYGQSDNPPILHRKEIFLKPDHPDAGHFATITAEAEAAGLYEKPRSIGFKKSWERLISQKGYILDDEGRLKPKCNHATNSPAVIGDVKVERHLTAIDRHKLSAPMQLLARHNFLDGQYSVFDYGCGKGDDIRELEAHGIDVSGWDPVHPSSADKQPADLVNLGYVINVIEDRAERDEALYGAYKLANVVLIVSAMIGGEAITSQFTPYKDGVVTSINTFQKYYSQSELRSYIETTLDETAIAAAPGVFLVFRDKDQEQLFLAERQRTVRDWKQLTKRERITPAREIGSDVIERNPELFEDFWQTCLELGRPPANSEFEFSQRIRSIAGSHAKAFDALKAHHGDQLFEEARKARREDLLTYFSLGLFGKRKPYRHMPDGLKRDLKAFFQSYANAMGEAKQLLFSIADTNLISAAAAEAHRQIGCGLLHDGEQFVFYRDYLNELPAILRIYVGCAAQLYGDLEEVQLIKIHIGSGKVSLMRYNGFFETALPDLVERTKINLRDQDIDVFNYTGQFTPQPLYQKSRYLKPDQPNYETQKRFDESIFSLGLFDFSNYGPPREEFLETLNRLGLTVKGFSLCRSRRMP